MIIGTYLEEVDKVVSVDSVRFDGRFSGSVIFGFVLLDVVKSNDKGMDAARANVQP